MTRLFAHTSTPATPNLANLQRAFWDLAVERFGWIKANTGQEDYCWSRFATDAAVVIVLAGTAISELLGQNTPSKGERVPSPQDAAKTLYAPDRVPPALNEFIDVYDALRHFGEPKHRLIRDLMNSDGPERLCRLLNAAAAVWPMVLNGIDAPHYPRASYRFAFDGFEDGPSLSDGYGDA